MELRTWTAGKNSRGLELQETLANTRTERIFFRRTRTQELLRTRTAGNFCEGNFPLESSHDFQLAGAGSMIPWSKCKACYDDGAN
jgi:hypothetical protein